MRRNRGFHWAVLRFVCLAVLVAWPITGSAGGGRIRVVDEYWNIDKTLTTTRGLIDLNVSLTWDPSNPTPVAGPGEPGPLWWSTQQLHEQFRTASTVLCDATDGRFRIGQVNFIIDPVGRGGSDIWYYHHEGNNSSDPYDIGKFGQHIYMNYNETDPGGTLAHELAHYALGLLDEYEEDQDTPCGFGAGFHDPIQPHTTTLRVIFFAPYNNAQSHFFAAAFPLQAGTKF